MISYANMKLKVDNSTYQFKWNDYTIDILNYLPIENKYDLIMITLQKSLENGYYNPIKLDKYFHLHLIYMYTNISFTEKQKEDSDKLYNCLKSNGLLDAFINEFNENEYNELYSLLNDTKEAILRQKLSVSGLLESVISDLPAQAEAMQNIIDNFNPEKYQEVINFAKVANGNRDIQ